MGRPERDADVEVGQGARVGRAVHHAAAGGDVPVVALLVVHRAERGAAVRVVPRGAELQHLVVGRHDILIVGQAVQPAVGGHFEGVVHGARLVVDKVAAVLHRAGVPLAARLGGAKQVVEVAGVVLGGDLPVHVGVVGVHVESFVGGERRVGRVRQGDVQVVERHGAEEMQPGAHGGGVLVPLHHRVGGGQADVGQALERPLVARERRQVNVGGGAGFPGLDDGVRLHHLLSEEPDGRRLRRTGALDFHRQEALACVAHRQQPPVGQGHGAEVAGLAVGEDGHFLGGQFVAEQVGGAGVVGGTHEVPAVGGEDEVGGDGVLEVKQRLVVLAAGEQCRRVQPDERLAAGDLAERRADGRSVRRDGQVVDVLAVGEGVYLVPLGPGVRDAHQRGDAVVVPHPPQGAVGRVEGQVAHPGVLEEGPVLAGAHVHHADVAPLVVVGGVEEHARGGIEGERGHEEHRRSLDVEDLAQGAAGRVDGGQVGDLPGVVHCGVERAGGRVVARPGHGAEGRGRQRLVHGDGVGPDGGEVLRLELLLPADPVGPGLVDGAAEHLPELPGEIGGAAVGALHPGDDLLGAVREGQVAHEPGAVEVRVHSDEEVDLGAGRLQRHQVEDGLVVQHHGAEGHLVVGAHGPAEAAGEPRLHEGGDPLVVPAGRVLAGAGHVPVQERQRVVVHGTDLAEEQTPAGAIAAGRLVRGHHVDELMVHDGVHALVHAHGLEVVGERGQPEHDVVHRDGAAGGVGVVVEVVQQDGDPAGGLVAEDLPVGLEGVLQAAGHVGDDVGVQLAEVDEPEVVRLDGLQAAPHGNGGHHDRQERRYPRPPATAHGSPPHASQAAGDSRRPNRTAGGPHPGGSASNLRPDVLPSQANRRPDPGMIPRQTSKAGPGRPPRSGGGSGSSTSPRWLSGPGSSCC